MLNQYLLDFLRYPILWFKTDFRKIYSLKWRGDRPHLSLIVKLIKDIEIPNKSILFALNFETLRIIQKGTAFFYGQEIKENGVYEENLLRKSTLSFFPHEVAQITIMNAQRELCCSKVYHGGQYALGAAKRIQKEVNRLCFVARKKGLIIEEVVLSHTHPSLEILIEQGGESKFIFNGLSKSDKEFANRLAPFLDYPLRIKAITPVANYSMLF